MSYAIGLIIPAEQDVAMEMLLGIQEVFPDAVWKGNGAKLIQGWPNAAHEIMLWIDTKTLTFAWSGVNISDIREQRRNGGIVLRYYYSVNEWKEWPR